MLYYQIDGYDFGMKYFNADGLESTMCGNGERCLAAFWRSKGKTNPSTRFKGIDGEHIAHFTGENLVQLGLKDVKNIIETGDGYLMNTGSPHFVTFVKDIDRINVNAEGKIIRYNKGLSKEGVNVNFVEISGEKIFIRTYERGVEEETLSCGTGSVAAAIAVCIKYGLKNNKFELNAPRGKLVVSFVKKDDNSFHEIFLEGTAVFVFEGTIII